MKQAILFSFALIASQGACASAQPSCYTPANTVFAFDIDQVILDGSDNISGILWRHKYALARIFGDFSFTKTMYSLWRSGAPVTDYLHACKESNHEDVMSFITDLINSRQPIYGTVVILNELKKLGYSLYIATNESPITYNLHKKRLPEIFNLFDGAKVVSPEEHVQGIKKPSKAYFEKLLALLAPEKAVCLGAPTVCPRAPKEFVIFIDDRTENILGAEKAGILGIQFVSPEQLRRELEHLRILPRAHTSAPAAETAEKAQAVAPAGVTPASTPAAQQFPASARAI